MELSELRHGLSNVEEAVVSLRREQQRDLAQLRSEHSRSLEQAAAAVATAAEGSLCALLEEERGRHAAEAAEWLLRLRALEEGAAATAPSLDAALVEAQLTTLCARLEAVSREVAACPPPAREAAAGEAEPAALVARLEAVETACRDVVAAASARQAQEAAAVGGELAVLKARLDALAQQVGQQGVGGSPQQDAADAAACGAAAREAVERSAGCGGQRLLVAKFAELVGRATRSPEMGACFAQSIGEMDAGLRAELADRVSALREHLCAEAREETHARICAVEASFGELVTNLQGKLVHGIEDLEARVRGLEAAPELEPRVAALEGESRRTADWVKGCAGDLFGRSPPSLQHDHCLGASYKAVDASATTVSTPTQATASEAPTAEPMDSGGSQSTVSTMSHREEQPRPRMVVVPVSIVAQERLSASLDALSAGASPAGQRSSPPAAAAWAAHGLLQQQHAGAPPHRGSSAPVAGLQSLGQPRAQPSPAAPLVPQAPQHDPVAASFAEASLSEDMQQPQDMMSFLKEIQQLRAANLALTVEVGSGREQALRQLRANAERSLWQQQAPVDSAEGPQVAPACPGASPPAAPLHHHAGALAAARALQVSYPRSVSPGASSPSRVRIVPQGAVVQQQRAGASPERSAAPGRSQSPHRVSRAEPGASPSHWHPASLAHGHVAW